MNDQSSDPHREPQIGLALSGGGSRAIAFHLGCLRALHRLGILSHVQVLSTVSGGSVIGALYALNGGSFAEFEQRTRQILAVGLVRPALRVAFLTPEGIKALACASMTGSIALGAQLAVWGLSLATLAVPAKWRGALRSEWHPPIRRFASRTTILARALDISLFGGARLSDLKGRKPFLILNAAELRTGSAFYFTANESGSWRLGRLARHDIELARAVVASAAYPVLLPALDERFPFDRRDGSRRIERVTLTDGGVYDNLGLAPLWPDRDTSVSLNVTRLDTIICCRAGYGLRHDPPNQFLLARLKSAFACVHERAQNATVQRLFDLKANGKLTTVVMPYLGQDDRRLRYPPSDLVSREDAYAYPTDFSAMSAEWIERLSIRGEQLTLALMREHAPHLHTLAKDSVS